MDKEDTIDLKSRLIQTVVEKAVKKAVEKTLRNSIGKNSRIVMDRFHMQHSDGQPVKLQVEVSAEIAEVDFLALVDKALGK